MSGLGRHLGPRVVAVLNFDYINCNKSNNNHCRNKNNNNEEIKSNNHHNSYENLGFRASWAAAVN